MHTVRDAFNCATRARVHHTFAGGMGHPVYVCLNKADTDARIRTDTYTCYTHAAYNSTIGFVMRYTLYILHAASVDWDTRISGACESDYD